MNIRKPVNYSAMFATMDLLMKASLPQMELYCEIGKLVSARPEKGAAVAAAEYLERLLPQEPPQNAGLLPCVCGRAGGHGGDHGHRLVAERSHPGGL